MTFVCTPHDIRALCNCYWCPNFLHLVCHTVCQLTLRSEQVSVKIAISEAKRYYGMLTSS